MQLTLGVEAKITKNALQVLYVFKLEIWNKLDQNQAINKKLLLGK